MITCKMHKLIAKIAEEKLWAVCFPSVAIKNSGRSEALKYS